MTQTPLGDEVVDAFEPEWRGDRSSFVVRAAAPPGAPPGALVLQNMTTIRDLDDLVLLVGGLIDSQVRGTDFGGYAFGAAGVLAWDAGDNEVNLSRPAFTRLLTRVLDEVIGHATMASGDDRAAALVSLAAELRRSEQLRRGGLSPGS